LNATADVAGTFVYDPAEGTKLTAGKHDLKVTFTPTDATNYVVVSKTVSINVSQATPSITWSNPDDIVYGTLLSTTHLNATADVGGIFTYDHSIGEKLPVGTHSLKVTFAPKDINYTTVSKATTINVIAPTLAVSSSSVNIEALENSTGTVDILSNTAWTASVDQSWITLSDTQGSGNKTLTIMASVNPVNTIRTANIILSADGATNQSVLITQAASGPGTSVSTEKNDKIIIYPNPATDGFYVKTSESGTLKVFTINGLLLFNQPIVNNDYISIGSWSRGVYVVQIITQHSKTQIQLIKK
jgi:hypothetical protein